MFYFEDNMQLACLPVEASVPSQAHGSAVSCFDLRQRPPNRNSVDWGPEVNVTASGMHVRPNQLVLEAALVLYWRSRESGMYRGGRRGALFSALRNLEISTNDTQGRYKEDRGPWWI